jgi:kinesin family protein 4/21/27
VKDLFKQIERQKQETSTRQTSVFVSFLQIYNEKVFDLLNPTSASLVVKKPSSNKAQGASLDQLPGLRMRWNKKDQFVVENLYIFEAFSAKEVLDLYRFGQKNKVLASHNLNEVSSRSHSIFALTLESMDLKDPNHITVSKLQLVDLAGSEKQSLTGTTGL